MELIITNRAWEDVMAVGDFDLDLAFGDDQNDFELEVHGHERLRAGCLVYVEGTEYGGIIDSIASDAEGIRYEGRTWHGMLAAKVLSPLSGQDYLTIAGGANDALRTLIELVGLGDIFRVVKGRGASLRGTYQFDRYTDAYTGIRKMLRSADLRLDMTYRDGAVWIGAVPAHTFGDDVDSDRAVFKIKRDYRPVNHLVCLGKGELKDRVVIHLFANEHGEVGYSQTFRGANEVARVYELSSSEADELRAKGISRLKQLQREGTIDVVADDGGEYAVGDWIVGRDNTSGQTVTSEVIKKIVKVDSGVARIEYECGMGNPVQLAV